ncbi:hypothetical protein CCACVL1_25602 [Corchorus capsularis]|uniref:Uncharacterized protein n=1 Tax=Corchorus capsularis TaxID=210143 RepID=A0A1R3GIY8_COCAP|nr:hypothetical protein CCACVL1_25602 [Corchorus capsularis]
MSFDRVLSGVRQCHRAKCQLASYTAYNL